VVIHLVRAAALGLGLGAATGVPLGVVNLSVVEAATRAGRRHAAAIGLGGALADTVHAGLAFVGIAPVLAARPELLRALAVASATIVIVYALVVWRGRARPVRVRPGRGVLLGLALTLPNPAPLAAWIAVASALFPDATTAEAIAAALGVGAGSALWFALLARLAARGRSSPLVTRWLPRAVAIVFVAIAIAAIVRAWS
jgi:threonine/homoserine/homoserine lactone efflux protein